MPIVGGWVVLAGAGWLVRRRRHTTPAAVRTARRRTIRTAGAGGGWLLLAAVEGAWGWPVAVLWVGGYGLAAPWWYRHRIPVPPPAPLALPAPPPPPVLEVAEPAPQIPALWAQRVGAANRVLAGSYLTNPDMIGPAQAWTAQLNPGVHTTATAIAAAPLIASALGLDIDQVTVDRHPAGGADRALILIVDRANNPLQRLNYHPGPDTVYNPDTGYADVGIHADETPGRWAFSIPTWGLAGGAIIGGIGSGKSTLITNLATTAAHTRILSLWAGDPQGGQSMPAVIRRATWPARTLDEILLQLRAAAKAIDIRGALNGLRGVELHVPTPQEPGILLILDEIHKIFVRGSEHAQLASLIAREGRKAAVAIIGADQYPGLPTFGDDEALRSSMFAKNLAVLRTASNVAKGMIPGLDLNPRDLPDRFSNGKPTSGLGYLVGQRTAPYRGWFTPQADEWMAAAPQVELDRVTANYIGSDYVDRAARAEAGRAAQARRIAALDPDALATLVAADPSLAAALKAHRTSEQPPTTAPGWTPPRPAALTLAPAPKFGPPPAAEQPHPNLPDLPELQNPSTAAIYRLLLAGVDRKGDLIARSGLSETQTRNILNALAAAGLAANPIHGQWIPTASHTQGHI
ncbi:AAA ATPase [Candidatus Protofrankia californiensis]|uniref:AAA ATPase n=1 Tax=Candidatus Protofrankia californiensis TaxID=1839754 RepID=A0A1C3NWJ6_9ACTN|nr:AAA ATPase [Candidatus Protofrankia californiensis]